MHATAYVIYLSYRNPRTLLMYRCQSAHKLVELDAHFRLFARFHPRTVVDLAAAPGGFSQVALQCMQQHPPPESSSALLPPLVIAVDQRPIEPLQGLVVVRGNILQHRQVLQSVEHNLQSSQPATSHNTANSSGGRGRAVEMILHDGVSVVKGQHAFSVTYAQNQMALSTLLLASKLFAQLGPPAGSSTARNHTQASTHSPHSSLSSSRATHGRESRAAASGQQSVPVCFISKVLRSPHLPQVLSATRALFRHVAVFKPPSSRAESQETYVVASHFLPHHWQQLQAYSASPDRHDSRRGVHDTEPRSRTPRSALHICPSLFSMPPAAEDCGAERHLVWNCLGCGRTCMGRQPCAHCGSFIPRQGRDNEN